MRCDHDDVLRSPAEVVARDHSALIVVDVQNDFVHPDGFTARVGGEVGPSVRAITRVNEAIDLFRQHEVPVVFLREIVSRATVLGNFLSRCGSYEECPVQEGTWGAEWYTDLTPPRDGEPVVDKPSYDGFQDSNLEVVLKQLAVRTCIYVGFASNVCVEATARHGFVKGYYSVLLADASAGDSLEAHDMCTKMWRAYYGAVLTVSELETLWQGAGAAR